MFSKLLNEFPNVTFIHKIVTCFCQTSWYCISCKLNACRKPIWNESLYYGNKHNFGKNIRGTCVRVQYHNWCQSKLIYSTLVRTNYVLWAAVRISGIFAHPTNVGKGKHTVTAAAGGRNFVRCRIIRNMLRAFRKPVKAFQYQRCYAKRCVYAVFERIVET